MDIRWLGKRGVRIDGNDACLVVDPGWTSVGELKRATDGADIVALSVRDDSAAATLESDGRFLIDGPGEYEIHGAFVVAVQTESRALDSTKGNGAGAAAPVMNTVFAIEMDDLTVCHLGALSHKLDRQQVEAIGRVDVLIVPVGGVDALRPSLAAEVVGQLDPSIVVPVNHSAGDLDGLGLADVSKFVEEMGLSREEAETILSLSTNRIPDDTQLRLLAPSSD